MGTGRGYSSRDGVFLGAAVCYTQKTPTGAWCTSRRLRSSVQVLPCNFACGEGDDSQPHYMNCRHLWQLISRPRDDSVESLTDRLGLTGHQDVSAAFERLVLAHYLYNATRTAPIAPDR